MWIPRVQDHAKRIFRNSPALQRPPTLPVEGLGFRGLGFSGLGSGCRAHSEAHGDLVSIPATISHTVSPDIHVFNPRTGDIEM